MAAAPTARYFVNKTLTKKKEVEEGEQVMPAVPLIKPGALPALNCIAQLELELLARARNERHALIDCPTRARAVEPAPSTLRH